MFYVVDELDNVATSFPCFLDAKEAAERLANRHNEQYRVLNSAWEVLDSFEPE